MKKKKILLLLLLTIILIILVILGIVFSSKYIIFTILGTISGILLGCIFPKLFTSFYQIATDKTNWMKQQTKFLNGKFVAQDDNVRISFAYLFRIKINGKYLLIKNNKTKRFQPIGGAYKYYDEEYKYLNSTFKIEHDNKIKVDNVTRNDYRLYIKNNQLRRFKKRFDNTNLRENISDLSREFKEEMKEILNNDLCKIDKLIYIYKGQHSIFDYSQHFECYELLVADIVEIVLDKEEESIANIMKKNDLKKFRLYTASEIKKLGIETDKEHLCETVSNHSFKILNETELEINKKVNNRFEVSIKKN